jgi:hypothetical protein
VNECWAACLGDCSDKISREHIISASLFLADKIMVQGLPWCKDEAKEIGLAALTKKILCTKHNSDLSEIDTAASDSMNVLRETTRLTNLRMDLKIKRPTIKRFHIDGLAFERWFLKTLINIAYKQAYPIGSKSAKQWVPSLDLVEIAFNRREFEPKAGLYFMGELGEKIDSTDRIRAITYTNESGYLVGALFYFRGYRFLLYIDQAGPGEQLHLIGPTSSRPSRPLYHLRKMRTMIGRHLSHVIEVHW